MQVNVHRKHSSAENSVFIPGYFLYSPPSSPHPHLPHPHNFDVSKPTFFDSQVSAHVSDPVSEDKVSISIENIRKKRLINFRLIKNF